MKTIQSIDETIHRNAVRHALAKVLSQLDSSQQLVQYRALLNACTEGKTDSPATDYCEPCQEHEDDSVLEMLERINTIIRETSSVLNGYKNFIAPNNEN